MGIFGGAVQAYGDLQAGRAQQENADYQAQVATYNQQVATQNATYETALGEEKAGLQQLTNRATMGNLKAAQGANGLDVNSGSALNTRIGAAQMGNAAVTQIKSDANRKAYNYNVQATNYGAQSTLLKQEGVQDIEASRIKATASLLAGASQDLQQGGSMALAAAAG